MAIVAEPSTQSGGRETGILVHGDNHFIVRGPLPNRDLTIELARLWSLIQIGRVMPEHVSSWTIVTREFRENLTWAVVVPADSPHSGAVTQLLSELRDRGIAIRNAGTDRW